jgi:AcrR family transcriptional regulator
LLSQKLVNYIRSMSSSRGAALAAPSAEKDVLRKLKPGPGLSRKAVAIDQKLRIRVALAALAAELGFASVTVRALIRRAGVSTSTFYNHYDSVEDCFASIIVMTIGILIGDIEEAARHGIDLLDGMQSGLRHLMGHLAREPDLAQAVFIESFAAGPRVRDEMGTSIGRLEELMTEAFSLAPRPAAGTTHLAAGLVAGVVATIRQTALTGRTEELPEVADELLDWMLSVAHEKVVAFCNPRSRLAGGIVGDRPPEIGAVQTSRESVADVSGRATMTAARLAAANGLTSLTSAKIRQDAGLSRREFERHFTGVEDCFLGAVDSVATLAANAAEGSAEGSKSWGTWTYKAMTTLCSLAAGDRGLSRLVLLDVTAAGRPGLLRRAQLIEQAAARIRQHAPADGRPSELTSAASVSAVWRIAETEVSAGRTKQLPRLAPVFAFMILASRRAGHHAQPVQPPELTLATVGTSAASFAVSAA